MNPRPGPPPSRLARLARRLARWLLALAVVAAVIGAAGYVWLDRTILQSLPTDLSDVREMRAPSSVTVFAADGSQVDEFYLERRVWVPIDELPRYVWMAFVQAEDRRFFAHKGVDLLGIARAMVVNLQAGEVQQGGSTLTQQLVKNMLVGKEKSYRRKIREAVLAWRLENELSKMEILELYLNFVPLGSGNYGVEAAARDYFGLSARNLDVGQAALLAGLVPAPSRYSPRANPEIAAERRALVLDGMVRDKVIRREVAEGAKDGPVLVDREDRPEDRPALGYITEVRRQIRGMLGDEIPYTLGLRVDTPLDLKLQEVATRAVREAVEAHRLRAGPLGAVRRLPPERWDAFLARGAGLSLDLETGVPLAPDPDQCFEALVGEGADLGQLLAGPFVFALAEADRSTRVQTGVEDEGPQPLEEVVQAGDVLQVCAREAGSVALDPRPWAEGAAVVVENATGRVVALVGGYRESLEGFVRATQARRQPGSSFKPYLYMAALLHGRTQLDAVLDAPVALPAGGGRWWRPSNYDGKYEGALPLRRALAKSLNTVAVRLILETGAGEVTRVAAEMGVGTPLRSDLTIALGSSELTPMDQAMGYSTIARDGVRMDPVYIDALLTEGRPLAKAGEPVVIDGWRAARLPGGPGVRALPAGEAYELKDMLTEVVRAGTAKKALRPDRDRAGKTGTTNGFQDAWFCGFTPNYTIVVWVGTDGTRALGDSETGGRTALPAWITIADALNEEGARFQPPPEVALVPLGGQWVAVPRGKIPASALSVPTLGDAPLPAFGVARR